MAWVIRQRRRLVLLCIAFGINGGALIATANLDFLTGIENRLVDLRIAYFTPPEDQSDDIAVVTVNEESLTDLACRCSCSNASRSCALYQRTPTTIANSAVTLTAIKAAAAGWRRTHFHVLSQNGVRRAKIGWSLTNRRRSSAS